MVREGAKFAIFRFIGMAANAGVVLSGEVQSKTSVASSGVSV